MSDCAFSDPTADATTKRSRANDTRRMTDPFQV